MRYVHQFLVTRVSLIAIGAMLTVPLPAGAGEIHGKQTGSNVSLGDGALNALTAGHHNTASGDDALSNNTTGNGNTASGYMALRYNTKGYNNTAIGDSALYNNTTGFSNTASGGYALVKNETGNNNTASGVAALGANTTGNNNTASGAGALHSNTKGYSNTASGSMALYKNSTGNNNTASGVGALTANTTGNNNTAIGRSAGKKNKTGSRNVFIGKGAGNNTVYINKSDQLVIANGPLPANQLVIGDFSKRTLLINGRTSISGDASINGDANVRGNLKVQGKAFAASFEKSDGRLKKDIQPLTHALDSILQLQAKTYRWKEDTSFANKKDIGLIAQDVEKVFPEFVAEDERGYKAIAYSKLTTVLIEAMKEQQGQITALEKENAQLKAIVEGQMEDLLARVSMLEGVSLVAN